MSNPTSNEWLNEGLTAFYRAERELVRALQMMGEAATQVVALADPREHAARLQHALQSVLVSATATLRDSHSKNPFPARDAAPDTVAPECVDQMRNAAMDSMHAFAHTVGQDAVVALVEKTAARRRQRPARKPRWPGPLHRLAKKA
jgi:ferritin-like metal-binding protein YciE